MLLGITQPVISSLKQEVRQASEMLRAGLDIMHLRKPDLDLTVLGKWLLSVQPALRKQISWHLPHAFRGLSAAETLAEAVDFSRFHGINRIHLPAWWRHEMQASTIALGLPQSFCELADNYQRSGHQIFSTSAHDLEEAIQQLTDFDYVLFGPLFDSHSKEGYLGDPARLIGVRQIMTEPVEIGGSDCPDNLGIDDQKRGQLIGLGGIDVDHLAQVRSAGFNGAAMLGSIWLQAEQGQHISYIKKCKRAWNG